MNKSANQYNNFKRWLEVILFQKRFENEAREEEPSGPEQIQRSVAFKFGVHRVNEDIDSLDEQFFRGGGFWTLSCGQRAKRH